MEEFWGADDELLHFWLVFRWFQTLLHSRMLRIQFKGTIKWILNMGHSYSKAWTWLLFNIQNQWIELTQHKVMFNFSKILRFTSNQSWVYSGVALIPFQVYSRSGVDLDCSTPWSRIYAARLIPFHWSRGVSFYSGLLQCLNFSRQNISDVFNSSFKRLFINKSFFHH